MIQMNLHQVAAIVGGSLVGKEARIQGVTTDSRQDCKGKLFVALKGENFDGHEFCQSAVAQGAAAVLVSSAVEVNVPQIICHDSLAALQALASAWVRQLPVKVIGVTGSNGKTTVKNMLHAVLSQKFQCFATKGNLNNEIGVPLSLLAISRTDEVAVIEMGAAQMGDIKLLAEMAQPVVALITNVSKAHIGRFGSKQKIADGKGEIYQALTASGLAVINQDSQYAEQWKSGLQSPMVGFGESDEASYQLIKKGKTYVLKKPDGVVMKLSLPVLGHHNYINASAACAIAFELGLTDDEVIKGLSEFKPEKGRLNVIKLSECLDLIDDSYNANPASVNAAIDVLKSQNKPTLLIFGDMAELGQESELLHNQIGDYAVNNGVDQVFAVGKYATNVCHGHEGQCQSFVAIEQLMAHLQQHKIEKGTVLVKGSRSMQLEKVVDMLASGAMR